MKSSMWVEFGQLAIKTNSVNMGQGFPNWSPPEFFLKNLK